MQTINILAIAGLVLVVLRVAIYWSDAKRQIIRRYERKRSNEAG